MYRVDLHHWTEGSGYSHSETFDNIEELVTAEEYFNSVDLEDFTGNIEIYDEDGNLVSEFFKA